jgi:hypothetical protein
LAGLSLFKSGDAGDFHVGACVRRRIEAAVEFVGKVRKLHCGGSLKTKEEHSTQKKRCRTEDSTPSPVLLKRGV